MNIWQALRKGLPRVLQVEEDPKVAALCATRSLPDRVTFLVKKREYTLFHQFFFQKVGMLVFF